MAKEAFLIYKSFYKPIKELTDEQFGRLFRALFEFQLEYENLKIEKDILMAFNFFKNQFRLDNLKYDNIIDKRKEFGKKGGLAKASKASKSYDCLAKLAVNDNENVKVNDNENVKEKENKEIQIQTSNLQIFYKNINELTKYQEFVYLKKCEYKKLCISWGDKVVDEAIVKLNAWKLEKLAQGDKKVKKGSDYLKMIKWTITATLEDMRKRNPKGYYNAIEIQKRFANNPELLNQIEELLVFNPELTKEDYLNMNKFELGQRWDIYQNELRKKGGIQNV